MSAPNGHAASSGKAVYPGISDLETHERPMHFSPERIAQVVAELEVPFAPSVIDWRTTNTSKDKTRGQMIPYADQRAYTDRLNQLLTPGGWTRKYKVDTTANFQRSKDQKTVAKIVVTCELTIFGLGTHSATGEEWSDDDNAATSAEAQAFKRACSCLGLGRYLYYFEGVWVDLDAHKRPKRLPKLPEWATPEGWRRGLRPDEVPNTKSDPDKSATKSAEDNDSNAHDFVPLIEKMAAPLGKVLYRGILKSVARAWNPNTIQDRSVAKLVYEHMQAAERGLSRLQAALERVGSDPLQPILKRLNCDSLDRIDNLETLKQVVLALEAIASRS